MKHLRFSEIRIIFEVKMVYEILMNREFPGRVMPMNNNDLYVITYMDCVVVIYT